MIVIYTDGSANANSKSQGYRLGGIGVVFMIDGEVKLTISKGYKNTKTGRMELTAALTALQTLDKSSKAVIYCDSEYVVKSFTENRIDKWALEGWTCQNADLMKKLYDEFYKFKPGQ